MVHSNTNSTKFKARIVTDGSMQDRSIYQEAETKKLEECISRKSLSKDQISLKLSNVHKKLTKIAEKLFFYSYFHIKYFENLNFKCS